MRSADVLLGSTLVPSCKDHLMSTCSIAIDQLQYIIMAQDTQLTDIANCAM